MKRALLSIAWTIIDTPAILAAEALGFLMLATLPVHPHHRDDLWTPAGYPIFKWAWANRWDHRLDAIGFDGVSYWLRLRCGKMSGGNDNPAPSPWCEFIAWATEPPPGHLTR